VEGGTHWECFDVHRSAKGARRERSNLISPIRVPVGCIYQSGRRCTPSPIANSNLVARWAN